jgi:hypothetical protein
LDSFTGGQEIPCFYGTRRFMTEFTRARHWTLSRTNLIQSTPTHPNLRSYRTT